MSIMCMYHDCSAPETHRLVITEHDSSENETLLFCDAHTNEVKRADKLGFLVITSITRLES